MGRPLAYFLTWTTYGSWLPGDQRGWVHHTDGAWHVPIREGSQRIKDYSQRLLSDSAIEFSLKQRQCVEQTLYECCRLRCWTIHACNVRTNHVHIVVTADDRSPEQVMNHLKSWASRILNENSLQKNTRRWWTKHGSTRYINTEETLAKAIEYVNNQ